MITILAGPLIEVVTNQGCDNLGQPELQITIQGSYELTQMQQELIDLKLQVDAIVIERETELMLRKTNPALQELYDQYQVIYTLVKKADNSVNSK